MGWLFNRSSDSDLAATKYAGRESATDRAARKRREGHRRNISKTAAAGERWERQDRARDREGRDRRTDWSA